MVDQVFRPIMARGWSTGAVPVTPAPLLSNKKIRHDKKDQKLVWLELAGFTAVIQSEYYSALPLPKPFCSRVGDLKKG